MRTRLTSTQSEILNYHALGAARRAYAAGETFASIAQRFGVCETTLRRLLYATGLEARPRGVVPAPIPVDLVRIDAKAGLSAHQIARKHGLDRRRVNAFLREHGLLRYAPGQSVLDPRGASITALQAVLRRRPPIVVPVRTWIECKSTNQWSAPEAEAIAFEVRAGRYQRIPRGRRGLPERRDIRAIVSNVYVFKRACTLMAKRAVRGA